MRTKQNDITEEVLVELLKRAAAAHGVHEQQELNGVFDEQWPEWYAAFMQRELKEGGFRIVRRGPSLAQSFDLSGDVEGWDAWL